MEHLKPLVEHVACTVQMQIALSLDWLTAVLTYVYIYIDMHINDMTSLGCCVYRYPYIAHSTHEYYSVSRNRETHTCANKATGARLRAGFLLICLYGCRGCGWLVNPIPPRTHDRIAVAQSSSDFKSVQSDLALRCRRHVSQQVAKNTNKCVRLAVAR